MTYTLNLMALKSQVSFSMSLPSSSLTEQNMPVRGTTLKTIQDMTPVYNETARL